MSVSTLTPDPTSQHRADSTPSEIPQPAPPPDEDTLAHALTIYTNAKQRRTLLRYLRTFHRDRRIALFRALGLE